MKPNILEEADNLTSGDRAKAYGPAKENFRKIADLWSAYKDVDFTEEDVAMFMILVKMARNTFKDKRDNLVDIAGYARTAEMCREDDAPKLLICGSCLEQVEPSSLDVHLNCKTCRRVS